MTTAGSEVRTQLSSALYYGAESEFALSLEYKKSNREAKGKSNRHLVSIGEKQTPLGWIRVVESTHFGACPSWSPVLEADSCPLFRVEIKQTCIWRWSQLRPHQLLVKCSCWKIQFHKGVARRWGEMRRPGWEGKGTEVVQPGREINWAFIRKSGNTGRGSTQLERAASE